MDEEHIKKHLDRPDRHFEFHDKVTYIEHQEITVQNGATFYNGPAPRNEASVIKEDEGCTQSPLTGSQCELSTIDRVNNGLKAVIKGGFMKNDYYYAALVKFINEKDFFGKEINFADMENVLRKSGLFVEEKCPKKGTIARISISGKYPNWKIDKNIDVWMDLKNLVGVFYEAYKS